MIFNVQIVVNFAVFGKLEKLIFSITSIKQLNDWDTIICKCASLINCDFYL